MAGSEETRNLIAFISRWLLQVAQFRDIKGVVAPFLTQARPLNTPAPAGVCSASAVSYV